MGKRVPAIHVLTLRPSEDVDVRDNPRIESEDGHDAESRRDEIQARAGSNIRLSRWSYSSLYERQAHWGHAIECRLCATVGRRSGHLLTHHFQNRRDLGIAGRTRGWQLDKPINDEGSEAVDY